MNHAVDWGVITPTDEESNLFTAYLEAIKFTETGDEDQPPRGAALDEDYMRQAMIECLAFYNRIACYLNVIDGADLEAQAGHDFWLTRNGHGTGFWDREDIYGETYAEMFTKIAKSFGETWAEFEEQDPTPWCSGCGSMTQEGCNCGPIADNN